MRAVVVVVAVAGCGDARQERLDAAPVPLDCAPIGCGDNATMEVTIAGDGANLAGGAARVCRNLLCVEGPLPLLPPSDAGYGSTLSGAFVANVTLWRRTPIEIVAATSEDSHLFADGDVYTLTVTDDGGLVLVEGTWTASYTELWGDSACNSLCRRATLEAIP